MLSFLRHAEKEDYMIVFENNAEKIRAYNNKIFDALREHPEWSNILEPVEHINEVFIPYSHFMKLATEDKKKEYGVVPDKDYDFTGFYIGRIGDIKKMTNYSIVDANVSYGIVDNASQVKEHCNIPENCVVLLSVLLRDDKNPHSGFSWDKLGPYYGIKKRKAKYLNDEPDIKMVYHFRVVKLAL